MAQTITIRRTVTGTTYAFSREFSITGAATLSFEETVPDTALSGAKLSMVLPIPNATSQVKALLLETTGPCKLEFLDAASAVLGDEKTLAGTSNALFFPTAEGQAAPGGVLAEDELIAGIRVWRDEVSPTGNVLLRGLILFDPTP